MIELIFVIVILGILAAVATPRLFATSDDAKAIAIFKSIENVINDGYAHVQATGDWLGFYLYSTDLMDKGGMMKIRYVKSPVESFNPVRDTRISFSSMEVSKGTCVGFMTGGTISERQGQIAMGISIITHDSSSIPLINDGEDKLCDMVRTLVREKYADNDYLSINPTVPVHFISFVSPNMENMFLEAAKK